MADDPPHVHLQRCTTIHRLALTSDTVPASTFEASHTYGIHTTTYTSTPHTHIHSHTLIPLPQSPLTHTSFFLPRYAMSSGPKFGAHMLAYPGDPSTFHAQFTIRLVKPGEAVNPTALKAAARGSHAARKHLLLATLEGQPQPQQEQSLQGGLAGQQQEAGQGQGVGAQQQQQRVPFYISIAPEAGFGRAKVA